jgi:hypothetical protein
LPRERRRRQTKKSFTHHTLRDCLSFAAFSSLRALEHGRQTHNNFKTRQGKLDAPLISPPASKPNSQLTRQVVSGNALSKSKTRQGHQPSSSIPPRTPTNLATEPESRDQLTRVGSPTMSSRIEDAQKASALDLR